jgi:hypothetical protein
MSSGGGAVGASSVSEGLANDTIRSLEKDSKSESSDPEVVVEKGEIINTTKISNTSSEDEEEEEVTHLLSHEVPFPIHPDEQPELQQFTIRAVLVGSILGGVIAASKSVLSLIVES